jgi:hypothetical protein
VWCCPQTSSDVRAVVQDNRVGLEAASVHRNRRRGTLWNAPRRQSRHPRCRTHHQKLRSCRRTSAGRRIRQNEARLLSCRQRCSWNGNLKTRSAYIRRLQSSAIQTGRGRSNIARSGNGHRHRRGSRHHALRRDSADRRGRIVSSNRRWCRWR